MSSKASEILGVTAKRPHTANRRIYTAGDGDSLPSRAPSRLHLDGRRRPSATRGGTSQYDPQRTNPSAVGSSSNSVRFANPPLSPIDNPLALRPLNDDESISPSVASSKRGPPSSWRGLVSRAGGSSASMSSRASQESETTLRSQNFGDGPSRSKSILKSALSRFTLRPAKSKNSMRSGFSSVASTAVTTAASTAVPTAATSRHATPRAQSPNNIRIPLPAGQIREESRGTDKVQQTSKRRKNSRMPLEVDRPPTRNWFDGLDEADFDDAKPTSPSLAQWSKPPGPVANGTSSSATKTIRHFSRPLVPPLPPPSDLESHPRKTIAKADDLENSGHLVKSKEAASPRRTEGKSRRTDIEPHAYSILNLSDSDERKDLAAAPSQRAGRPSSHTKQGSNESNSSAKKFVIVGRPPPGRQKPTQPPPRTSSVQRMDEEQAELSPSLPSLVESGSSRQASVNSSASHGRPAMTNSATGNPFGSFKRRALEDRYEDLYRDSIDQPRLASLELEDQGFDRDQANQRNATTLNQTDQVMTALSREELAWLAHMRSNRSKAFEALNPPPDVAEKPEPTQDQLHEEIEVADYGDFHTPAVNNQSKPAPTSAIQTLSEEPASQEEMQSDDELLLTDARDSVIYSPVHGESRTRGSQMDSGLRIAVTDGLLETSAPEALKGGLASGSEAESENTEASEATEVDRTVLRYDVSASSGDQGQADSSDGPKEPTDVVHEVSAPASNLNVVTVQDKKPEAIDVPVSAESPGATDSRLIITTSRRSPPAKQESISYAEAKSRFEKPAPKSSLPVPKRLSLVANRASSSSPSGAKGSRSPRIPVSPGKVRDARQALHPSGASRASSSDVASLRNSGLDHEPPTPNLASFPQPPGSGADTEDGAHGLVDSSDVEADAQTESRRTSDSNGDVMAAWQSLGG